MAPPSGSLLLVEDDAVLRGIYATKLEAAGFTVYPAGDGATARSLYQEHRPLLACLDCRLPDESGVDLGTDLAALGARVLLLTNDQEIVDKPPKGVAGALLKIMTPPATLIDELVRLLAESAGRLA